MTYKQDMTELSCVIFIHSTYSRNNISIPNAKQRKYQKQKASKLFKNFGEIPEYFVTSICKRGSIFLTLVRRYDGTETSIPDLIPEQNTCLVRKLIEQRRLLHLLKVYTHARPYPSCTTGPKAPIRTAGLERVLVDNTL